MSSEITIDYGYDSHNIVVDDETLSKIVAGEGVSIDGQGFLHDEEGGFVDHWYINLEARIAGFTIDNGCEFPGRALWLKDGERIDLQG